MKWFCFMFWFCYRFFMTCLQHFNFTIAIYTNCAYFVMWKTYDLLWFWMHIILCTCFPMLRRENYLLVWCNLLKKKYTKYPNHTYKRIYLMTYGGIGTKAEIELENIESKERTEKAERASRRLRRTKFREKARKGIFVPVEELESSSSSDEENTIGVQMQEKNDFKARVPDVIREEEEECRKYCYVGQAVDDSNNDLESMALPTPQPRPKKCNGYDRVTLQCKMEEFKDANAVAESNEDCQKPSTSSPNESAEREIKTIKNVNSDEESDTNSTSKWFDNVSVIPKVIKDRFHRSSKFNESASPPLPPLPRVKYYDTDNISVTSTWSRIKDMILNVSMPKFNRSASNDPETDPPIHILRPDFTNTYDLLNSKKRAQREKRDKKALTKRVRRRIKDELKKKAAKERRRRMITDAIELILQLLRMMTSFAVLVGNIRKTFIPAQFKYLRKGQRHNDNPYLIMLFRVTTFMDVTMFSINFLWVYCLQWHLCCRLGIVRFWFWTFVLITVATTCMLTPISYAMDQLDPSWCHFQNGSTLEKFQPIW